MIDIRVFKFKDLNARENYQKHSSHINKRVVEQLPSDIHAHFKCIMNGGSVDEIYTENGWFSDPDSFPFSYAEVREYLDEISDFEEQGKDEIIADLHYRVHELEEKLRKIKEIL